MKRPGYGPVLDLAHAALAERGGNPKVLVLLRLGRALGRMHLVDPETGARV